MSKFVSEIIKHLVAAVTDLGDDSLKELSRLKKNATRLILSVSD
jgi:hypothetical protein